MADSGRLARTDRNTWAMVGTWRGVWVGGGDGACLVQPLHHVVGLPSSSCRVSCRSARVIAVAVDCGLISVYLD